MSAAYLWLNAALYGLLAIWCTLGMHQTSAALGYEQLTSSGRSEYLVIYGGLQLGLAVFFAYCALNQPLHRVGLFLALALYLPIVVFRWATVARFWPVAGMTVGVGVLETVLLIGAAVLYLRGR